MTDMTVTSNSTDRNMALKDIFTKAFGPEVQAVYPEFFVMRSARRFTPPVIEKHTKCAKSDCAITIKGVPPINDRKLDRSAIERIINHIKDAFICGKYYDERLLKYCKDRKNNDQPSDFGFCLSYVFRHDGKDTLTIDFYVSRTTRTPAWGTYINLKKAKKRELERLQVKPNKFGFIPETLMSQDECTFVLRAFLRQCRNALNNYVNMVYNHAIMYQIEPDYYTTPTPETK